MNHFAKILMLTMVLLPGFTPVYAAEKVDNKNTEMVAVNASKMSSVPKVQASPVPNIPKPVVVKPFSLPASPVKVTPSYASGVVVKRAISAAELTAMREAAVAHAPKTTVANLQEAFNGESNAYARYLAFAQKADAEGYGKAASLFRAAAMAERVHLERHAKIIKKLGAHPVARMEPPNVKTTAENLESAFKGETYESTVMYPGFLALAEKEGNEDAVDAFEDAQAAEAVHAALYKSAIDHLKAWKTGRNDFYVCPFCGHVVEKLDFQECPICGTDKGKFLTAK